MILKGIYFQKIKTSKGRWPNKDPYYQTKEWKQIRAYKFQLNPLCEDCQDEGKTTPTHTIDHIVPRKQGGSDSIDNLRSRCKHHNAVKTAYDN